MKNHILMTGFCLILLLVCVWPVGASIVSTSGLTVITPAPGTLVTADFLINNGLPPQIIFNERQNVLLAAPLVTDTGTIPAGTVVDSAFFALNSVVGAVVDTSATFDGTVLGVVYLDGSPNYATSDFLGLPTLVYAESCPLCGFETGDSITSMVGSTVSFHNSYSEPGDFARIITLAVPVPEPSSLLLLGSGIVGLAGFSRRKMRM